MFPQDEFRLTRQAAFALLISSALSPSAYAAAAGRVEFAIGDVSATSPDGQVRRLLKGADVLVGDTLVTGANGRAQVRFADGAYSSLQPETRFRVDQYQYEGKTDGSEKGFFSLLKGGLRTITGAIGRVNQKTYQVTTPTATIGIRGTEYLAREVASLSVSVGEGLVEVCNAGGCITVADGESVFVKDASTRPVFTQQKTEAPPPPPQPPQEGFRVAENRNESGGLPPLSGPLPSGPGYALGFVHFGSSVGGPGTLVPNTTPAFPGTANFDTNNGGLTSYLDGGEGSFPSFGPFSFFLGGALAPESSNDDIIGWGRWTTGALVEQFSSSTFVTAIRDVHYIVGKPTSDVEMMALFSQNVTATYSLLGGSNPTSLDPVTNATIVGRLNSGSLTADFGFSQAFVSLNLGIGGHTYDISGAEGQINPCCGGVPKARFNAFANFFSGTISSSTGGCASSSCFAFMEGFFTGSNAARAGLVYHIDNAASGAGIGNGSIIGAAAFKKNP